MIRFQAFIQCDMPKCLNEVTALTISTSASHASTEARFQAIRGGWRTTNKFVCPACAKTAAGRKAGGK